MTTPTQTVPTWGELTPEQRSEFTSRLLNMTNQGCNAHGIAKGFYKTLAHALRTGTIQTTDVTTTATRKSTKGTTAPVKTSTDTTRAMVQDILSDNSLSGRQKLDALDTLMGDTPSRTGNAPSTKTTKRAGKTKQTQTVTAVEHELRRLQKLGITAEQIVSAAAPMLGANGGSRTTERELAGTGSR